MRFTWLMMVALLGVTMQAKAANPYSVEYQQCMNFSYGSPEKAEKCIKKELKAQRKTMTKAYQKFVKLNPTHTENIKQQQALWERQVQQQCTQQSGNNYLEIQQGICVLAMVVEQSAYYQSRSLNAP